MKLGLKLAIAAFPVPMVFFVFKHKEPWWVKILSTIWALFFGLMLLGSFGQGMTSENVKGILIISFLAASFCGLVHSIQYALAKAKEQKQDSEYKRSSSDLNEQDIKALYKKITVILKDKEVDLDELLSLMDWFAEHPRSAKDYRTQEMYALVVEIAKDGEYDEDEASELFVVLTEFCDDYESSQHLKNPKIKLKKSGYQSPLASLPLDLEYAMEYIDSKGNLSHRVITPISIQKNKQITYLNAYCSSAGGYRTFRADRIQSLCCLETGELFV